MPVMSSAVRVLLSQRPQLPLLSKSLVADQGEVLRQVFFPEDGFFYFHRTSGRRRSLEVSHLLSCLGDPRLHSRVPSEA